MHWILITILISLCVNIILAFLLHNSNTYEDDPFKMPLIIWLLFIIITFIPIANVITSGVSVIITIMAYASGEIELKETCWLMKRY